MPSSLIIVALAVAWLVVLVPMVVRKRQEIAETGEDALASRVVRGARDEVVDQEEEGMPEPTDHDEDAYEEESAEDEARGFDREEDVERKDFGDERLTRADVRENDYRNDDYAEPSQRERRYRPGRGGFDPHAAEIAARAKYAYRQRVVMALLATVVISAIVAGVVFTPLWWLTGAAGTLLVGYLVYLRRQVRIENEIRQRRMDRLAGARAAERRRLRDEELDRVYDRRIERDLRDEYDAGYDEYELAEEGPVPLVGVERKPRPTPRVQPRNTVVVDVYDEDPAFHELDEPDHPVYRRAVGE